MSARVVLSEPEERAIAAALARTDAARKRPRMARDVNLSVSIKSSGIPDAVKREVLRALIERFSDVRVELDDE